jgi:hypothetical protein
MRSISKQCLLWSLVVLSFTLTTFAQDPGKNGKRNSRPQQEAGDTVDPNPGERSGQRYRYEFSQPDFVVSHIVIEHSADGRGTITFDRKDYEEEITDPLVLSPITVKAIDEALAELNFLNSREEYQYSKDYSHMGQMQFTLTDGERSRTVKYNWTDNKGAKALGDEYRKVANQYIWMFDINLARENQPLESPRVVSRLDSFLRRGEISDPPNMLPFLRSLTTDERMPLMARNHIIRLIEKIEKAKK